MSETKHKNRRLKLLRRFAVIANGRHDEKVSFEATAPQLEIRRATGGKTLFPKNTPPNAGDSELAYDINTLLEDNMIQFTYMRYVSGSAMDQKGEGPAFTVTRQGLEAVSEFSKSWLRKSIEKQPITFLSVLTTIILSTVGFVGGILTERHILKSDQTQTKQTPTNATALPPSSSSEVDGE